MKSYLADRKYNVQHLENIDPEKLRLIIRDSLKKSPNKEYWINEYIRFRPIN